MSANDKKDSDFSAEVIRVLRSERVDAKNRLDLRVVKWSRSPYPVLEKRRVWEREGEDRPSKTVGLNADDIRFIYDNYPDIINLL